MSDRAPSSSRCYCVYVLSCSDASLYTGYTGNLKQRLEKHARGKASKYTRSRLPIMLQGYWSLSGRREAMRIERRLKALPRERKLALLESNENVLVGDVCLGVARHDVP